jgi:predicted GIY-YIG superfamily endonuclease
VYLILRKNTGGNFTLLYIGQTGDLSTRFDNHHKQWCFDRNGKTHIGVLPEPNEQRRLAIEADLLKAHRTPCND